MTKKFCLLLLCSISLSIQAQNLLFPVYLLGIGADSSKVHGGIVTEGAYSLNSNAITNSTINGILRDGIVSEDTKTDVTEKLSDQNRAAQQAFGSISYYHQLKDSSLLFYVSYEDQFIGLVNVSHDALLLAMNGNSPYAGNEMRVGKLQVFSTQYQQLQGGIVKHLYGKKMAVSAGISLVKGNGYSEINIAEGTVFTEEYGRYIDLSGSYHSENAPYPSNYFGATGGGLALNFSVVKYFDDEANSNLIVRVKDLGFMSTSNVEIYDTSGTYRYEGYVIDDFFDLQFDIAERDSSSIESLIGLNPSYESKTRLLPGRVDVQFNKRWNKILLQTGAGYQYLPAYWPRVYAKLSYALLSDKLAISPSLTFGGYGVLDFGLGLNGWLNEHFYYNFDVNYLEALTLPKTTTGQGLRLGLSYCF